MGTHPIVNKEFMVCFNNDNLLVMKETPVNIRRVPFLCLSTPLNSKDHIGNKHVTNLRERNWVNCEIWLTPTSFDWCQKDYMESLAEKYDEWEFRRSNMLFISCIPSKRVRSYDTQNFLMFFSYPMLRFGIKPPFTPVSMIDLVVIKSDPFTTEP